MTNYQNAHLCANSLQHPLGIQLPNINASIDLEMSLIKWVKTGTQIWNSLIERGFGNSDYEIFDSPMLCSPASILDQRDVFTNNSLWIRDAEQQKTVQAYTLTTIVSGLERLSRIDGDATARIVNGKFQSQPGYPKTRGWMIKDAKRVVLLGLPDLHSLKIV